MADLGAVGLLPHFPRVRAELQPISKYNVVRGSYLGVISLRDPDLVRATLLSPVNGYVVRQIRVLFRQLWPARGQRFPQ